MKRRKKPFIILAVILVVVLLVAGYIKFFNGRLIYFTTGMKSGELIKTAGQKTTYTCEADILMSDVKKTTSCCAGFGQSGLPGLS